MLGPKVVKYLAQFCAFVPKSLWLTSGVVLGHKNPKPPPSDKQPGAVSEGHGQINEAATPWVAAAEPVPANKAGRG